MARPGGERRHNPSTMLSARLRYEPLLTANLDAFHRLVQDEHVRRYMMNGFVRVLEKLGFERTEA